MKHWTIARRIILGFTAVILTAIALGAFAYIRLVTIKRGTTEIARQSVPGLLAIGGIESLARQNYSATLKYVAAKTAGERAALMSVIQTNITRINTLTNDYAATIEQPQARELFEGMLKARAAYVPAFKTVCQMIDEGKAAEAVAYFQTQVEPASSGFMSAIEAAVAQNKAATTLVTTRIDDSTRSAQNGILAGLGAAVAAAVAMSLIIILAINRVLTTVATTLDQGAGELAAAAGEVAAASQSLAEGNSEQAASLEETSASLEEMASMTRRNAEDAANAKELANQTRAAAEAGATDMRAMNTAMEAIKTSSDNIAKIIKTIDEIAFQTNILALNAAVEAARAGEAGMGFAVVAEEVRNLAQRSAQAARDTAERIEDSIRKSEDGVGISAKVAQALEEMVAKVRAMDQFVAGIAAASSEQSQGISQVNQAIGQMDKVTQSSAASAEETAGASEELNAQAVAVSESVAELMRLTGNATRPVRAKNNAPQPADPGQGSVTKPARRPAKTDGRFDANVWNMTPEMEAKPADKEALSSTPGKSGNQHLAPAIAGT